MGIIKNKNKNMKNIKTKIILSAIIFLSVMGFVGTANAAGASLYISPASLTKITGDTFSVSIGFNASGSKVCAVEGTLVFNNLSCQSITVASDVMAQSSPTCSNPHFLIGIPNCTTLDKTLLTTSVISGSTGTASISITSVDIIGEGASVGSTSISGNYAISALPVVQTQTPPAQQPKVTKTVEKTTPKTEQTAVTPPESANSETANQPANALTASLVGSGVNNFSAFLMAIGGWLFSNLIWIIVLILATAIAYIIGRVSCKKNKKDFLTNLLKKTK